MKTLINFYHKLKKISFVQALILIVISMLPFIFISEPPVQNPEITSRIARIAAVGAENRSTSAIILAVLGRLVPFTILFYWFLTSKRKWYHIILIPLVVYTYQLLKITLVDEWWFLPASIIIAPLMYLIKLHFYNIAQGEQFKTLEKELKALEENPIEPEIKTEFIERKPKETYMTISEWIDYQFSTHNLHFVFRQFSNNVRSWTHLW